MLYNDAILAELCPRVVWKAELVSNQPEYLAEKISRKLSRYTFFFLLIIKYEWKEVS